ALLDRRRVHHAPRPAGEGSLPLRAVAARAGDLCAFPPADRRELPADHRRRHLHQGHRLLPPRRHPWRLVPARQGVRDCPARATRPGLRLGGEEPLPAVRHERAVRAAVPRPARPPGDRRCRAARAARRRRDGLTALDAYLILKTVHVVSATILFGTGIGIAFFFLVGLRSGDVAAAYFAARTTAIADMLLTLSAGVVQPLSGLGLILLAGWDPWALWLVATYALSLLALACWRPVVWLQLRMRDMLRAKLAGEPIDEALLQRRFRWWFALGWPAFVGLVAVFWLMVAKPA